MLKVDLHSRSESEIVVMLLRTGPDLRLDRNEPR
jgi:hypothetical protein